MMKQIFYCIIFLLFQPIEVNSQEIQIKYIGIDCYESNMDINGFYKVCDSWPYMIEDLYSCYVENDSTIKDIMLYLSDREPSEDIYAWPIAILYVSNEYKTDVYEIGLRRMKKVGEKKAYKVPWNLWMLLKDLIPFNPIYDYYTDKIYMKGITNEKGYYYTD